MKTRIFPLSTNKQRTYILLTEVMDLFEPSILGGKSKLFRASRLANIQYGDGPVIEDDIDFTKKIFRSRSRFVVTKFLDDNNINVGDLLQIAKIAPFSYRITAVNKAHQ